jgi:hypothetical protein
MRAAPALLAAVALSLWAGVAAALTTLVTDLPTRGTAVRFREVRPDAPVANVLVWPGGSGNLGMRSDGSTTTVLSFCNPPTVNQHLLAEHGYAVAVVDIAQDGSAWNFDDMVEVVRHFQARNSLPTWVIHGSVGAYSAVDLLARAPMRSSLGIVFYSPERFDPSQAASITSPAMVIYHAQDPRTQGAALVASLTSATPKESVVLDGGGGTDQGCDAGYHSFNGLHDQFVAAVTSFIDRHSALLVRDAAPALAVEFYNAQLDHFFLTHVTAEIAILDAGTVSKGWVRTGESFKVYAAAQAGSSPVCRFYIPPGLGDSHFYGRGIAECDQTGLANPSFVNEDAQFFHVVLPSSGTCPAGTAPVYRVFSNRTDANHRYMVKRELRSQMVARGWLAEGDGPDLVVMCAPT